MFNCKNCGVNTLTKGEYYMVTNDLWYSVMNKGMLCVGCLETRLKRKLTPVDFTICPLNEERHLFESFGGIKKKKSVRLLRRQGFLN